jgi:transposase
VFEEWIDVLISSFFNMSLSDVERSINALRRYMVLENVSPVQAVIDLAIKDIPNQDKSSRQKLAIELARAKLMSHNKIMALTGVSRDTIRKYAGPSPIKGRGPKKGV